MNAPAPLSFAELAPASIESSVLTGYEQVAGVTLYPGDPVRLFLESLAYVLAVQNQVIDLAGKQNLLAFAQAQHLDEVARMVGTVRLEAAAARCTQRFALAEALPFDVLVPAGTRVTTGDAKLTFASHESVVIAAGSLFAEVMVEASLAGSHANGLVAGQIGRLVDPVAHVAQTANVTPSTQGADVESDARLRERAQLAPEAFSCAGPRGAYRFHAMSAHQAIADAAVWSPTPGTVDIRPVLKGGELPPDEVLDVVREKLSADDVRPLTDTVIVAAPEPAPYELSVSWSLRREDEALAQSLTRRVEAAIEAYRLWQRSVPGRDVNPTKLISLMEQAGARRVVPGFEFAKIEPRQIAREKQVDVTFLGIEDA